MNYRQLSDKLIVKLSGKILEVFVLDGEYEGLQVINLKNWSGRAFVGHREFLASIREHKGLKTPSFYLLLKSEPNEDSGNFPVYIGETESFGYRVGGHKDKPWWDKFVCFTSADDSITKAHVKHLEKQFYDYLNEKDVPVDIMNTQPPTGAALPNSDQCFLDGFAENILFILKTIGIDYFQESQVASVTEIRMASKSGGEYRDYSLLNGYRFYFELPVFGGKARMRVENGKCVVEKGSLICAIPKDSFGDSSYFRYWEELVNSDSVESTERKELLCLTRDYEAGTPSHAGSIAYAGRFNGPKYWLETGSGKRFKDLQIEIIEKSA